MANPAPANPKPPNPKKNDTWIDDSGELRYFDGTDWVSYASPPKPGEDPHPSTVVKGESPN